MSKKTNLWFPHEMNALNNRGLNSMFKKYNAQGYGIWWRLTEILATLPEYKMEISNEEFYHELADDLRCDVGTLLSFVDDCIKKYKLLQKDDTHLWSPILINDLEPLEELRAERSEAGKRGGLASGRVRREKAAMKEAAIEANEATVEATMKQNEAHNITQQTEQTQQTVDDSREKENSPTAPEVEGTVAAEPTAPYLPFATLEQLRDRALADEFHFTALYVAQKQVPDADTLRQWLDAFHRWLRYCGEHVKNEKDYRTHFKNWFAKQDKKMPPARYDPVPRAINLPTAKTAQELLAEQSMTPDQVRNCFKNAS